MARFTPNPAAEANLAFDVVQPAVYRMRVSKTKEEKVSEKGNTCVPVGFEYVDPSACVKLDGGVASNPGMLWDNGIIISPADKQGKLRSLVEACGKTWGDIEDVTDLVGCELDVKVKTEVQPPEFGGETRNAIARYMPVK